MVLLMLKLMVLQMICFFFFFFFSFISFFFFPFFFVYFIFFSFFFFLFLSLFSFSLSPLSSPFPGGVKKYQEAFFNSEYVQNEKGQAQFLPQFLDELQKTLPFLESGLEFHRKFCPEPMKPLQEKMEKFFGSMKERVGGIVVPPELEEECK